MSAFTKNIPSFYQKIRWFHALSWIINDLKYFPAAIKSRRKLELGFLQLLIIHAYLNSHPWPVTSSLFRFLPPDCKTTYRYYHLPPSLGSFFYYFGKCRMTGLFSLGCSSISCSASLPVFTIFSRHIFPVVRKSSSWWCSIKCNRKDPSVSPFLWTIFSFTYPMP